MYPSLDLHISESAKLKIAELLRGQPEGSIPLLLLAVRGLERERVVEIGFYPPETAAEMTSEYAKFGADLVHDCHGTLVAIFDDDKLDELTGRMLSFIDGEYHLKSH